MSHILRRRLAASAIVAGLLCGAATAVAAPALAAPAMAKQLSPNHTVGASLTGTVKANDFWVDQITRQQEVAFAESHWNWTAWNDSTPVAGGADQPNYQCAEFVARAMAAAGLIPGLSPDAPQNDYFNYTAPNGKVYDLLLISVLPQYNNIYDYLMDSGLGIDVGDNPAAAQPGDFVVTYLGPNNTSSHMGLVATAPTVTSEATVDAHNHARLHYGYHFYAPSHLVELAPDALWKVHLWVAKYKNPANTPLPQLTPATPNGAHGPAGVGRFADPAGPQV